MRVVVWVWEEGGGETERRGGGREREEGDSKEKENEQIKEKQTLGCDGVYYC